MRNKQSLLGLAIACATALCACGQSSLPPADAGIDGVDARFDAGDTRVCTADIDCMGSICAGGLCAETCHAGNRECPRGTECVVPGDSAGFCLVPCTMCGDDCGPTALCAPVRGGDGFFCVGEGPWSDGCP